MESHKCSEFTLLKWKSFFYVQIFNYWVASCFHTSLWRLYGFLFRIRAFVSGFEYIVADPKHRFLCQRLILLLDAYSSVPEVTKSWQSGLIVNISFYWNLSRFIVVYICGLPVELQAKGYNVPDYPANPKERLSSMVDSKTKKQLLQAYRTFLLVSTSVHKILL